LIVATSMTVVEALVEHRYSANCEMMPPLESGGSISIRPA